MYFLFVCILLVVPASAYLELLTFIRLLNKKVVQNPVADVANYPLMLIKITFYQ